MAQMMCMNKMKNSLMFVFLLLNLKMISRGWLKQEMDFKQNVIKKLFFRTTYGVKCLEDGLWESVPDDIYCVLHTGKQCK